MTFYNPDGRKAVVFTTHGYEGEVQDWATTRSPAGELLTEQIFASRQEAIRAVIDRGFHLEPNQPTPRAGRSETLAEEDARVFKESYSSKC